VRRRRITARPGKLELLLVSAAVERLEMAAANCGGSRLEKTERINPFVASETTPSPKRENKNNQTIQPARAGVHNRRWTVAIDLVTACTCGQTFSGQLEPLDQDRKKASTVSSTSHLYKPVNLLLLPSAVCPLPR
jgi:hypothetical protein